MDVQQRWVQEQLRATFSDHGLRASVDAVHPDIGLQNVTFDGRSLPGQFLRLLRIDRAATDLQARSTESSWPLPLHELYVRGADLVATYSPVETWPYSPQVYWRAGAAETNQVTDAASVAGAFSVLVSVQTHLLDTWPRISIDTDLASDDVLRMDWRGVNQVAVEPLTGDTKIEPAAAIIAIIRRLRGSSWSYAEIMASTDFHELTIQRASEYGVHTRWVLFSEFLEKGVIRRARLHGIFLPRAGDSDLVSSYCQAIATEDLPLTT